MPKRFLLSLLLILAVGLTFGGCGSADGINDGARLGAVESVLPFLSSGEQLVLALKNLTSQAAPVYLTAYDSAGGMYGAGNTLVTVPGEGETQVPLSTVTGGASINGGYVRVETRDVMTLDAVTGLPTQVPTSGFVLPSIHRSVGGGSPEEDSSGGIAPRASGVSLALTPYTNRAQLINFSTLENAGGAMAQPLQFDIRTFDASGAQVGVTQQPVVAANATFEWTPTTTTGYVSIEPTPAVIPAGFHVQYALAGRENTIQTSVESRFLEPNTGHWPGILDLGFEMAFGSDLAGNLHDFGLVMSNPTTSTETVVLQAIYRKGGNPILTSPRTFVLGGGRSVIMKSSTTLSRGLEQGEVSWFDDLFGDVFQAQDLDEFTLVVQAPNTLNVSARHYDPSFNAFYQVLRAIPRTNRACIYGFPIETTASGGFRNYVSITNTTNGPLKVPIRGFTPMLGTEYILPTVTVPARSRLDWSPDGMIFREQPSDTVGPPVTNLRLEMVPLTGALFRSRSEARDQNELLIFITPRLTRD